MTTEQFAYWLKGFFEIENPQGPLDERKVKIIKDHLDLVFNKTTPDRDAKITKESLIDFLRKKNYDDGYKDESFTPDINTPLCSGTDFSSDTSNNHRQKHSTLHLSC